MESSDDLLFYCCPEHLCHFKCKSKQDLIDHALANHEAAARDVCENFRHELSVESKNEKNESTILELIACQTYDNKETTKTSFKHTNTTENIANREQYGHGKQCT